MSGAEVDADILHSAMVDDLKRRGLLKSTVVEAAFRAVPRHRFLPDTALKQVYADEPIVTRYDERKQPISSSSQPAIMAVMLEMLNLQPGQAVLEIGAGTGYNAALMATIVGDSGRVVTIDIDEDIVLAASQQLAGAGYGQVRVLCGDGARGCELFAPFDRIILTVGAEDISPAWRDQLTSAGRLVLPLSLRCTPRVFAFVRTSENSMLSVGVTPGGFMPLRGGDAPGVHVFSLPGRKGPTIWTDHAVKVDLAAISHRLGAPGRNFATGVYVDSFSSWAGWALWLELREPAFGQVYSDTYEQKRSYSQIPGLIENDQIALITLSPKHTAEHKTFPMELWVRCFGESDALAERLIGLLRAWQAAGSPRLEDDLHVRAFPANGSLKFQEGAFIIRKTHMTYVVEVQQ
jgi:protein-L-isoaspartate(D-aspartate) O-methyltransferase